MEEFEPKKEDKIQCLCGTKISEKAQWKENEKNITIDATLHQGQTKGEGKSINCTVKAHILALPFDAE